MKAVSGRHFCKILEIYTMPGDPATISVPVHGNKDLKKGLQADLMKQAGLTESDL